MSDKLISGTTTIFQKALNSTIKYKILLATLIPFVFYLILSSYFGSLDFLDDVFVSGPSLFLITASFILVASVFMFFYFVFCGLIAIFIHTPRNDYDLLYSTKGISDIPAVSFLVCILSYQLTFLEGWKGIFTKNLYFLSLIPIISFVTGYISLRYTLRNCEAWHSYKKYELKNETPFIAMTLMIAFTASAHFLISLVFFNKHDGTWHWSGYITFIFLIALQHLPAFASVTTKVRKKSYKEQAKAFFITASVALFFVFYFSPSLALKSIPLSLHIAGKAEWDAKTYLVKINAIDKKEYNAKYWGEFDFHERDDVYAIRGVVAFKTKDEYILCPEKLGDLLRILFKVDFVWENINEKSLAKIQTASIIRTCPKIKRSDIREDLI